MLFNGNYKLCYSNIFKFIVMCDMYREIYKSMVIMEINNSEIFFICNFNCFWIFVGCIFLDDEYLLEMGMKLFFKSIILFKFM